MRKIMRATKVFGIALGGVLSLVGTMSVVGLVTSNFWVRLGVGLVVVIGLPSFLSDRLLKRTDADLASRASLAMVADVFAIVLLGLSLALVAGEAVTKRLVVHEGDLYARAGATVIARVVYFIAGVTPSFPSEKAPLTPGSVSAMPSSSAEPRPSR